jgi:hypothetical protein
VIVEMATESVIVSVKDKKFTFESQVSAIGGCYLADTVHL